MSKQLFRLVHDEARRRAVAAVANAPAGYVVKVEEETRNGAQNNALHARLTEIAEHCTWIGKRWDVEVWKRLLTASWCRVVGESIVMLPSLDGQGVDIVFRKTSSLTKSECSSLLEFVNAWAAEQPEMQAMECEE